MIQNGRELAPGLTFGKAADVEIRGNDCNMVCKLIIGRRCVRKRKRFPVYLHDDNIRLLKHFVTNFMHWKFLSQFISAQSINQFQRGTSSVKISYNKKVKAYYIIFASLASLCNPKMRQTSQLIIVSFEKANDELTIIHSINLQFKSYIKFLQHLPVRLLYCLFCAFTVSSMTDKRFDKRWSSKTSDELVAATGCCTGSRVTQLAVHSSFLVISFGWLWPS